MYIIKKINNNTRYAGKIISLTIVFLYLFFANSIATDDDITSVNVHSSDMYLLVGSSFKRNIQ